ncbi:hypothetical protein AAFF_G00303650 [Aldrovandia affinis]|uniref:J domain-containing protein n=1 Tax=Aldrovandia affinis TaxID=143900 RepID=A0AAD7W121_9TELE|nr:hypothetical protein AAFF_G00303650 [Aldrovandia affinis]
MDDDEEESDRLIEKAKLCLRSGRRDRALQLLHEAQRTHTSGRAGVLIDAILRNGSVAGEGEEEEDTTGGHERKKGYTEEQQLGVFRIKRCQDYYEVLGVAKEASDEQLKTAYRKLALRFHPDKNCAPGATDAFKVIGNAYAVLGNPEQRRQYDQEGRHADQEGRHADRQNSHPDFEVSPEDLFNEFFRGRFPTGNIHVYSSSSSSSRGSSYPQPSRRRRGPERRDEEEEPENSHSQNSFTAFLQLLPVLVLVLISVVTQLMATNPPYSLFYKPAMGLVVSRETQNMAVPYFVDRSFEEEYSGADLQDLERAVERDFMEQLQASCWKEKQQKSDLASLGQLYRDERLKQKAESLRLESCEKLQRIVRARGVRTEGPAGPVSHSSERLLVLVLVLVLVLSPAAASVSWSWSGSVSREGGVSWSGPVPSPGRGDSALDLFFSDQAASLERGTREGGMGLVKNPDNPVYVQMNRDHTSPSSLTWVTTCAALHNVCLPAGDVLEPEDDVDGVQVPPPCPGRNEQQGQGARERLAAQRPAPHSSCCRLYFRHPSTTPVRSELCRLPSPLPGADSQLPPRWHSQPEPTLARRGIEPRCAGSGWACHSSRRLRTGANELEDTAHGSPHPWFCYRTPAVLLWVNLLNVLVKFHFLHVNIWAMGAVRERGEGQVEMVVCVEKEDYSFTWLYMVLYLEAGDNPISCHSYMLRILQTRRQHGEYHRLVQELRLDGERFQRYFRLDRAQFDELLTRVGPRITRQDTNWRSPINEAFPLQRHLMRPFPGSNLSRRNRVFNYRLSRARMIVENTFSILSAQWRMYRRVIGTSPGNVEKCVKATCVLHNFMRWTAESPAAERQAPKPVDLQPIRRVGTNNATREAIHVRETLASYFSAEGAVPWQDNVA